jgi:hypothetical protein
MSRISKLPKFSSNNFVDYKPGANFEFAFMMNFILLLFCSIIVFSYFGGYEALTASIGRGELRRTDYGAGPIQPFVASFLPKFLLMYIAVGYFILRTRGCSRIARLVFYTSFIITLFLALMTGFKGAFIGYIAPAIILCAYISGVSFFKLAFFGSVVFFLLVLASYILLSEGVAVDGVLDLIFHRVVIVPSEYPYHILSSFPLDGSFLEYSKTLVYFLGGTVFNFVVGANFENLVEYNFVWKMTSLIGYGASAQEQGGHSNTMSIIGESYYALGVLGLLVFPIILSFSIIFFQNSLFKALRKGRYFFVAVILHLFWAGIIPWVNGGGVARVLNLNDLVFYFTLFFLYYLRLGGFSIYLRRVNKA